MKDKKEIDLKKFYSIDLMRFSDDIKGNDDLINDFGSCIALLSVDDHFETQEIDKNFVKLFKISQILMKYLFNELNGYKNCENETKSHKNLIQENKKLRKLLEIHQKAMTYSRTLNGDYVQCPNCPKVFFDTTFLKTHFTRRHPKESLDSEGMLSLTNKIDKYQRVVLGDNQTLDQLKRDLQVLTEKLTKAEVSLLSEREERIKLEERFEYVLKVRDKELQQSLREELEDLKFVRRERDINREFESNKQDIDKDFNKTIDESDEQNVKSIETNKIEEMIAIQSKQMKRLGDSFHKLVTHLTDTSPQNVGQTLRAQELSNVSKVTKTQTVLKHSSETPDKNVSEIKETIVEKTKPIEMNDVFHQIESSLNEKLVSFGIDVNSRGISDKQYSYSMRKLNEERELSIHQNRHDFDYEDIEQHIKRFVDKKVNERSVETHKQSVITVPKVKERKALMEKQQLIESQTPVPIEPIVNILDKKEFNVLFKDKTSVEETTEPIIAEPEDTTAAQVSEKSPKSPKSALKSVKSDSEKGPKDKERRIRFSDHRIEHQISPEESTEDSSEDSSDEYNPMDINSGNYVSFDPNKAYMTPIPAQRSRKIPTTLELKIESKSETKGYLNEDNNEDTNEDNNYEINDQMMNEILGNSFTTDAKQSEKQTKSQTKVHELTQMIEQQLSKRSSDPKRAPIGSVNVMAVDKQTGRRLDYDSDDSY